MTTKKYISATKRTLATLSVFFFISALSFAKYDNLVRIKSLEGSWKFSIGEREEWLEKSFDDSDWETIHVPAAWEDQGFYGYNGFASYRKSFEVPVNYKGKNLYLVLGYIDDVDETYVNGHKIGSTGSFPPAYNTAYNAKRVYFIPSDILNFSGTNVIAVKVYDSHQYGGIVNGQVGIYANPNEAPVEINLQGTWKFKTGDDFDRKEPAYNDGSWEDIFVPGKWEDQGYRDYDGYAWYRKSFTYRGEFTDSKAVLLLGKIDDGDEVYVNGVKIGSTGEFKGVEYERIGTGDRYRALRGYYFDTSILKKGQKNYIAVRVYDSGGEGGIYEGPVGLISQKEYIEHWRWRSKMQR